MSREVNCLCSKVMQLFRALPAKQLNSAIVDLRCSVYFYVWSFSFIQNMTLWSRLGVPNSCLKQGRWEALPGGCEVGMSTQLIPWLVFARKQKRSKRWQNVSRHNSLLSLSHVFLESWQRLTLAQISYSIVRLQRPTEQRSAKNMKINTAVNMARERHKSHANCEDLFTVLHPFWTLHELNRKSTNSSKETSMR